MKKFINSFRCKIFGHKWFIIYVYGLRVNCKCQRCNIIRDDYIHNFVKIVN